MPLTHAPKLYLVGTCTEAHDDPRHPTSHRPPNDLLLLPASSCLYVSLWVLGIVCSSGTDLDSGTELNSGTVLVSRVLTSVGHHPGSGHRQRLGHRPRLGHALSSITMQRRTTSASGTPSCLMHAARLGPRPRPGHRRPLGHRPRLEHRPRLGHRLQLGHCPCLRCQTRLASTRCASTTSIPSRSPSIST